MSHAKAASAVHTLDYTNPCLSLMSSTIFQQLLPSRVRRRTICDVASRSKVLSCDTNVAAPVYPIPPEAPGDYASVKVQMAELEKWCHELAMAVSEFQEDEPKMACHRRVHLATEP